MRPELLEDSHICLQEEEEWENRQIGQEATAVNQI